MIINAKDVLNQYVINVDTVSFISTFRTTLMNNISFLLMHFFFIYTYLKNNYLISYCIINTRGGPKNKPRLGKPKNLNRFGSVHDFRK